MNISNDIQRCFYCKRSFIEENYGTNKPCARTRDHIIPVSKGGCHRPINMVYACSECNGAKCNLSLTEFIDKINDHIGRRKRIKTIIPALLPEIIKNVEILQQYANEKGEKLYAKYKPKPSEKQFKHDLRESNWPTISEINKEVKKVKRNRKWLIDQAADASLSVNNNTPRANVSFIVSKVLAEAETNFHYL